MSCSFNQSVYSLKSGFVVMGLGMSLGIGTNNTVGGSIADLCIKVIPEAIFQVRSFRFGTVGPLNRLINISPRFAVIQGAIWPSLSPCTVINPILLTIFCGNPKIIFFSVAYRDGKSISIIELLYLDNINKYPVHYAKLTLMQPMWSTYLNHLVFLIWYPYSLSFLIW